MGPLGLGGSQKGSQRKLLYLWYLGETGTLGPLNPETYRPPLFERVGAYGSHSSGAATVSLCWWPG